MAVPACLRLADDVFPIARAEAARRLADEGWSQTRIAKSLGISQALVSKHVGTPASSHALANHLAADLVREILAPTPAAGPSGWCTTLTLGQGRPGAAEALEDLLGAEAQLMRKPPLRLMPQVGLNLARSLDGASSAADVLAFPGRLVEAGGRIVRPAPPAFGGSSHLAGLLLASRAHAIANVRGGADVAAACKRLAWKPTQVARTGRTGDADAPILRAVRDAPAATLVHDPGAVGLEPCLYVFGPSAGAVVTSILELHAAVGKA